MNIFKNPKYLDVTYENRDISYPIKLANWIHKNIFKIPKNLLDVGCGCGDYLYSFGIFGYQTFGVDIGPIKYAIQADLEKEKETIAEFDYIFSKSVIEHIKNVDNSIEFMYNNLKKDGKIVIMTPAYEYIYWGPFYCDHTHVTPFTKESLENILKIHNFKNVKVDYFYQLPFIWKYPFLKWFCKLINFLRIPYKKNKLIRFSREVMLLAQATK